MMKDIKTKGDEEEEEEEDSTLDVLETQDEDVQGKENKEDVVKLIEIVVEEYVKDPNMENVEDENVKDSEAEEYGKDTEGRRLSCDIFFFVTAANKRNSRNFAMKRYKIKAHGEKEILKKSVKVKKMLNKRKLRKRQNLNFLKWRRTM